LYSLVLSDGEYFAQAMLATAQNHLVNVADNPIQKHTLIKLLTYAVNDVQNRRIVIALTLDVVGQTETKIGNPQAIEPTNGARQDSAQPEQKPNVAAPQQQAGSAAGRGVGGSNASKTAAAKRGGAASRAGGRAGGSNLDAPIYPIESLSPYQNK
jgi:replication factor A1